MRPIFDMHALNEGVGAIVTIVCQPHGAKHGLYGSFWAHRDDTRGFDNLRLY